ncbi:hypothetical protein [Staphylothermus hellenicus]|uniref:Uncharacterized protein n=1 Tax=Staphylothermus hellenicus (strain DSM 12710 / JCM 10830 / BK20S6-10-b1 / P8) TaxID=591019 RepID=D7DAG0_STAHD|nr:hypothetical protein [Staphylothermus hellenicus]ADI31157.1 hypothetical protein Shell_0004 [Staphylothermus hellenicus DSM 12710]
MSEELTSKLENLFNEMKDWERRPVVKSGRIIIELVKLPEKHSRSTIKPASLALMIRREDAFRGIIIGSAEEIDDLRTAISIEKIRDLAKAIKEFNRKRAIKEFEI